MGEMQKRFEKIQDPDKRARVLKFMYSGEVSEFARHAPVVIAVSYRSGGIGLLSAAAGRAELVDPCSPTGFLWTVRLKVWTMKLVLSSD